MDKCKILSWNIRGFGSSKNKCNLRSLVSKHDPSVLCIQESMSSQIIDKDLEFIWSHKEAKAVFQPTVGHSGGIFTSWDANLFDLFNLKSLNICLGVSLKCKTSVLL